MSYLTTKDKILFVPRVIWIIIVVIGTFIWFALTASKAEKEYFKRHF